MSSKKTDTGLSSSSERRRSVAGSGDLDAETMKKVQEAFEVFDHEHNRTVDVREIGTIIRSLGYCPSETDLHEVLRDMEGPQQTGYVHFDRFLPVITKIMLDQKFQAASADVLLKAFQVLDADQKGFLTEEELRRIFTTLGQPFSMDEIDEFVNCAIDPQSRRLVYSTYLHYLTVDEDAI